MEMCLSLLAVLPHHRSRSRSPDKGSLQSALPAVAGVLAEIAHMAVTLPLDLVKVRLQLRTGLFYPEGRGGAARCICVTRRREGLFALWKGFVPSMSLKVSKVAFKFMCLEYWVDVMTVGPEPTALSFTLAGMVVGVSEAVMFNFLEVLKVSQQADRRRMGLSPGVWEVATDLVRRHGFRAGLAHRGLGPTVARDTVFNGAYFGVYYSARGRLAGGGGDAVELAELAVVGLVASVAACVLCMPFDVVKTRVQAVPPYRRGQPRPGTVTALWLIGRREGWTALYRGLGPKLVRVAPGGTVTFLVYDYTFSRLQAAAARWRDRYR